jgi:hypothetical protein
MNNNENTTRVFFMSPPKTTPRDPRAYLVKRPGEYYACVRVTPDPIDPNVRHYKCDCEPPDRCPHIPAAIEIDSRKFTWPIMD